MKKFTLYQIVCLAFIILSLGSCKKEDVALSKEEFAAMKEDIAQIKENVDYTSEYNIQTDDQLLISAEIEAVTIDANTAAEATAQGNSVNGICDGTVTVGESSAFKIITINYNGVNCAGRTKREGIVVVKMHKRQQWSDAGAVLNIAYENLKVTRTSDNKYVILNGALDLTNHSGGSLNEIFVRNLVHLIHTSSMDVTFDDGTKRAWQLAVRRTYSFDNGLVISSVGDRSEGNKDGISAWGTTRAGRRFVTIIAEPMVIRQDCYFRLVSAKLIQEQGNTLTINFGLDQNGQPVTCPQGSFYLKVSWTGAGNPGGSILLPY